MNRRTFLARFGFGTVAAAAAVLTFDVEKLLWIPGEKTIFIPEEFSTGNTFITPEWVTREVAQYWKNNLKLVSRFDRSWDDVFAGGSVEVRLPKRWAS